jgi:hypothetical protein
MSFNLALHPSEQRQAIEQEKARSFEFWQQNLERAKGQAGKLWAEKSRRKGQWRGWVVEELERLEPAQFRTMVERELRQLG